MSDSINLSGLAIFSTGEQINEYGLSNNQYLTDGTYPEYVLIVDCNSAAFLWKKNTKPYIRNVNNTNPKNRRYYRHYLPNFNFTDVVKRVYVQVQNYLVTLETNYGDLITEDLTNLTIGGITGEEHLLDLEKCGKFKNPYLMTFAGSIDGNGLCTVSLCSDLLTIDPNTDCSNMAFVQVSQVPANETCSSIILDWTYPAPVISNSVCVNSIEKTVNENVYRGFTINSPGDYEINLMVYFYFDQQDLTDPKFQFALVTIDDIGNKKTIDCRPPLLTLSAPVAPLQGSLQTYKLRQSFVYLAKASTTFFVYASINNGLTIQSPTTVTYKFCQIEITKIV